MRTKAIAVVLTALTVLGLAAAPASASRQYCSGQPEPACTLRDLGFFNDGDTATVTFTNDSSRPAVIGVGTQRANIRAQEHAVNGLPVRLAAFSSLTLSIPVSAGPRGADVIGHITSGPGSPFGCSGLSVAVS